MNVRFEDRSILIDGRPVVLFSGEIQYYRLPPGEWLDRLEKLRAMGLNCVGTYVCWNFHSRSRDEVDFSSPSRDLGRFLDLAAHTGLDVIIRPGPYVCNEWDLGGYPGWLLAESSGDWRTGDPAHLAWCRTWYAAADAVIAPRQATRGGSVVLYQVENEHWWGDRALFDGLVAAAERDGIDVPFISNSGGGFYRAGCTRVADGSDAYTPVYAYGHFRSFASHLMRVAPPDHPIMVPEFRTSNMPFWGETAPDETAFPSHWPVTFARGLVGAGANLTNFFVAAGGITPLGLGSDHISTCYGADAPVAPWGGLTRKFYLVRPLAEAIATFNEQLSVARPHNEGRNTDNTQVDCLLRAGPRGTFAFPINTSDQPQSFSVVLPDGRRLPQEGTISIAPRQSMFLADGVDLGGGATLVSCTVQVMKIWRDGDALRIVVFGDEGTRGSAVVALDGETAQIPFACSSTVGVSRARAGRTAVVLYAITPELAERTWFVPGEGKTVALFGGLDLVRPGADDAGRVRAEAAAGGDVRVTADAERVELDGVAAACTRRADGLGEFVAPGRDVDVRASYGSPLARAEDESWTVTAPMTVAGWRAVDPFGPGPDAITSTGAYQYRMSFDLDGELPETLEFMGLSSVEAVVFVNGRRVGSFPARRPNGYHLLESLSPCFPVAGAVKRGRNELAVAFTVVGRHNQGRPIRAGFTRPPVLYRTRDEEALDVWRESAMSDRRWGEAEVNDASAVASEVAASDAWATVDFSRPRDPVKTDGDHWHQVRFYRTRVRVPERMRGRALFLECPKGDQTWVYVDGVRAGVAGTDQAKRFDLRRFAGREELDVVIALRPEWKQVMALTASPRLVAVDRVLDTGWWRRDGRQGEREGWPTRVDGWTPAESTPAASIAWFRQSIAVERTAGAWAPLYVELDELWREHATIYWNGAAIGQYAGVGPDRRFYVADELVARDNVLVIAVDGHGMDAHLGTVRVDAYERRIAYALAVR